MELQQLKYFVAVAQTGSFSAAAASHKIAQPKISRYIRALEEEVGTALFYRHGRGADLTEAGTFLLKQGAEMLEMSNRIQAGIQSIIGSPGGTVTVGLPTTISSIVTIEIMEKVHVTYPRIQLSIREAASDHILEWLSTGHLDIAVLVDAPAVSTLLVQDLTDEPMLLVGSSGRAPATGTAPAICDLVRGETILIPGTMRSISRYREDPTFAEAVLLPLDCLAAVVDFMRRDRGYAILPASYVDRLIEARFVGELAVRALPHRRSLSMATSSQRTFTPAANVVANEIAGFIRAVARRHSSGSPQGVRHKHAA